MKCGDFPAESNVTPAALIGKTSTTRRTKWSRIRWMGKSVISVRANSLSTDERVSSLTIRPPGITHKGPAHGLDGNDSSKFDRRVTVHATKKRNRWPWGCWSSGRAAAFGRDPSWMPRRMPRRNATRCRALPAQRSQASPLSRDRQRGVKTSEPLRGVALTWLHGSPNGIRTRAATLRG